MKLQVIGCNHRTASVEVRQRLALAGNEIPRVLENFVDQFPGSEVVIVSTCNRVEIYTAAEEHLPSFDDVVRFLATHRPASDDIPTEAFYHYRHAEAVRHLFRVAASLDSMVVGEAQILAQVKEAYRIAVETETTGPITHAWFQSALKTARRVASETALQQRRVSIPSVAVGDFGRRIFERFDDKMVLVVGAGEMADETLRYLREEGAVMVSVVNRSPDKAKELAAKWKGTAHPWEHLFAALDAADIVVSTTGAGEPIVRFEDFRKTVSPRYERPLFILDLAVPMDFERSIGDLPGVYLYCIDDLEEACARNRQERDREIPVAEKIVDQETKAFLTTLQQRISGPLIRRLREDWHEVKEAELARLFNKLPDIDDKAKREIRIAFDRLVNKLLHPPLESLREPSAGTLLEAVKKLFRLNDPNE